MLFSQKLNRQKQQQYLQILTNYIAQILKNNSTKISYDDGHRCVYQLCMNQKQQKTFTTVKSVLNKLLPQILAQIKMQQKNILCEVAQTIQKTQNNLQSIKAVCLKLDKDYFKQKMMTKLNQIFLQIFLEKQNLLQSIGQTIALQHIQGKEQNIKTVILAIKKIDPEQEYFTKHFVKNYTHLLNKHYQQLAHKKFQEFNTSEKIINYLNFAQQQLIKQTDFLNSFWQSNKCQQNKNFILRQLYEVLVTQYKNEFYEKHKQKIFQELTLNLLQIFKYSKNDDIQKHANWYNQVIKQKLSGFDSTHNKQFIDKICEFYLKIMGILQKTNKKFDIHYRSRFAFQEWINIERIQMPMRLNQYIKQYCLKTSPDQNDDKFLQKTSIIFRQMKQKNVFEKHYRRELINRMLMNLQTFNLQRQSKIIKMMQKQCSEEFIKNIKPIIDDYQITKFNNNDSLNVLLINSQNWPYDEKNISVQAQRQMNELTEKYQHNFKEKEKHKSLIWHPIVGIVKVGIKFLKSEWEGQLIVNSCMANILLYFTKTKNSFELKNFCCQTGYKLDQIYDSVKRLIQAKIVINQGNEDNYKLALNEQFTIQSKSIDLLAVETDKKFDVKHLEQLKADRKLMVEAIIVKIMKKLKVSESKIVLEQAAPLIEKRGFNFNSRFVESAIERLVQKEFIRDLEDGRLSYIA